MHKTTGSNKTTTASSLSEMLKDDCEDGSQPSTNFYPQAKRHNSKGNGSSISKTEQGENPDSTHRHASLDNDECPDEMRSTGEDDEVVKIDCDDIDNIPCSQHVSQVSKCSIKSDTSISHSRSYLKMYSSRSHSFLQQGISDEAQAIPQLLKQSLTDSLSNEDTNSDMPPLQTYTSVVPNKEDTRPLSSKHSPPSNLTPLSVLSDKGRLFDLIEPRHHDSTPQTTNSLPSQLHSSKVDSDMSTNSPSGHSHSIIHTPTHISQNNPNNYQGSSFPSQNNKALDKMANLRHIFDLAGDENSQQSSGMVYQLPSIRSSYVSLGLGNIGGSNTQPLQCDPAASPNRPAPSIRAHTSTSKPSFLISDILGITGVQSHEKCPSADVSFGGRFSNFSHVRPGAFSKTSVGNDSSFSPGNTRDGASDLTAASATMRPNDDGCADDDMLDDMEEDEQDSASESKD